MVPKSLEDFNTFICGELGEQREAKGCGRITYTAHNLTPPHLDIDENMPRQENGWGGYGWWTEEHRAAVASQDLILSGRLTAGRAGTELRLCKKCDPLSWENLTDKTRSGIAKMFHGGQVANEIAALTGENPAEVFNEVIAPAIRDEE